MPKNMRLPLKELTVFGIAAVIALKLFSFGLSYPLKARVQADAHEYLLIADKFDSFSSVLAYAGERTVGFPLFEFLVRKVLSLFVSSLYLRTWVDAICATLLI